MATGCDAINPIFLLKVSNIYILWGNRYIYTQLDYSNIGEKKMKETQTSLRTLWTIISLLDGEMKNQTDLVKYLNSIHSKINNYPTTPIKTDKSTFSHIIKYLSNKKIIKIRSKDVEGTNLKANYCYLVNNFQTFTRIIDEITISKVDDRRKNFFINCLVRSEIGKTQLKPKIIKNLIENNFPDEVFNENEIKFIINAIKNSPQALIYTMKIIRNYKDSNLSEDINFYLYKTQALLNLDILEQFHNFQTSTDIGKQVKFETNITFPTSISKNEIKSIITDDSNKFILLSNYINNTNRPEEALNEYIRTYY